MDYIKRFKLMAFVSAVIILAGLVVGLLAGGLNVGVDFTGGTEFTVDLKDDFDMNVIETALEQAGVAGAQAVRAGATSSTQTEAIIRMKSLNDDALESEQRTNALTIIQQTYPNAQIKLVDRVDGVASADLIRNAFLSVLIASALILVYIWIRFELYSGFAAVIALLHDVAIMLSLTCILRIQVNSSFIAAVLTIVGYSINNTIVIFDRIRENSKNDLYISKHRDDVVNKSIQETLSRSINTSVTTLLTVVMIYILGIQSIKEFTLPIIIGLLAGTYSSIFLASPMWALWYSRRQQKEKTQKAQKKGKSKK